MVNLPETKTNQQSPFDQIRHFDENGNEYWIARELMPLLGYKQWRRFRDVILNAQENVETVIGSASNHFVSTDNLVKRPQGGGSKQEDFNLSRLACYHIALSCDSRGNEEVKSAKHYFTVKTREAEVAKEVEPAQPQQQLPPERDSVDYINAAKIVGELEDPMMKSIMSQLLMEEGQSKLQKSLPPEKQTCILTVRAKQLGYKDSQIGNGSQLGKYVKQRVEPAGKQQHGRYEVHVYNITPDLDSAIHEFFAW